MEFSHPCFQKDHPFLLEHIKRKIANPKPIATAIEDKTYIKSEAVNKVMNEVKQMRNRQETLDSRFSAMKQENEALWREIAILRQKHSKQQQIVNKLIQFLVTLVQPTRGGGGINTMSGVKRRFQLMINDVPESSKLQKPNENTVPVIRELTEDLFDEVNYTEGEDIDYDEDNGHTDVFVTSPTAASPNNYQTSRGNEKVESISSPTNFHIEHGTSIVDHPESDADEHFSNNNGHTGDTIDYIISDVMDSDEKQDTSQMPTDEWLEDNILSPGMIKQEPAEPLVISAVQENYLDSNNQYQQLGNKKFKLEPVTVRTVNGKTLMTQKKKNSPILHLNISKNQKNPPMVKLAVPPSYSTVSTGVGGKVYLNKVGSGHNFGTGKFINTMNQNNQASTSAGSGFKTSPITIINRKPSPKVYTNKNDFISTEIPNELFDSQDGSVSPMIGDLTSGKYNPTLSEDYTKKIFPTTSTSSSSSSSVVNNSAIASGSVAGSSTGKNMAITKYNNNKIKNDELARINSVYVAFFLINQNSKKFIFSFFFRDDVNMQLDSIQGDLDSIKELFKGDDYTLDTNALLGVSVKYLFIII